MESKNGIESALANLIQLSSEKGFLVFDDIYDEADKWALSIRDVDYLSSSIVTRGILVYDEAPVTNAAGSSEDDYDDYAQRDYEAVFNRVIELDPDLEDFINAVRAVVPPQARVLDGEGTFILAHFRLCLLRFLALSEKVPVPAAKRSLSASPNRSDTS